MAMLNNQMVTILRYDHLRDNWYELSQFTQVDCRGIYCNHLTTKPWSVHPGIGGTPNPLLTWWKQLQYGSIIGRLMEDKRKIVRILMEYSWDYKVVPP